MIQIGPHGPRRGFTPVTKCDYQSGTKNSVAGGRAHRHRHRRPESVVYGWRIQGGNQNGASVIKR